MPNAPLAPTVSWLRAAAALALALGTPVLLQPGCGNAATACVPGQSVSCVGNQSCSDAYQVCKDDGSGFGECACSGGDGGKGTFPPVGKNSGLIGAACESDANCRRGLECVPSSSAFMNGEGPSGGLCLARCVPEHDFCNTLDEKAKCRPIDDRGTPSVDDDVAYCFPGCSLGTTSKDPDKCRSRPDVVCSEQPTGSRQGICIPACRADIDCKPRFCDVGTGLCGDAAPTGLPIGSSCSPDPAPNTCAGFCDPHLSSYGECSGICSYGEPGACGQDRTSPPYDYFCATDVASESGPGDLGYCAKVCNCDTDCDRPDAVCEPAPDLVAKTGRTGICGSKLLPAGTPRKNRPCTP